jgi:hypothetical protein
MERRHLLKLELPNVVCRPAGLRCNDAHDLVHLNPSRCCSNTFSGSTTTLSGIRKGSKTIFSALSMSVCADKGQHVALFSTVLETQRYEIQEITVYFQQIKN